MRYLIFWRDGEGDGTPFFTNVFTFENHYLPGMTVVDLSNGMFTMNGFTWAEIPIDIL